MTQTRARTAALATAAALCLALLSACAPAVSTATPTPTDAAAAPAVTPTPVATPTPTASALGPLPANALFRITAKAVQPNGATVDLVQTVFEPAALDAADKAALDKQCTDPGASTPYWTAQFHHGYLALVATMSATLEPGSAAFDSKAVIGAPFANGPTVFTGDYSPAQAECAPGYFSAVPGAMRAVSPVSATNPSTGAAGWAVSGTGYGFFGGGNDPGEQDGPSDHTIVKDCGVEIGATALATAPSIGAWTTQPFSQKRGCYYEVK